MKSKQTFIKLSLIALTVLILGAFAWQIEDVSNFTGIQVKATALATATPLTELWRGNTGQALVIRNTSGTPQAWVNSDGATTINNLTAPTFVATAVSGGSLTIGGVAFSGPIRFGNLTFTDGVTVTHSLGTTPTSVIISPSWTSTSVTQTLFITNVGSSTFEVKITDGAITTTTAYWMAGK